MAFSRVFRRWTRGYRKWWFVCECAGITCATLTHCILAYANYCTTTFTLSGGDKKPADFVLWVVLEVLYFLAVASHLNAMLTDPGSVPYCDPEVAEGLGPSESSKGSFCRKCDNFKPPRAHHCSTCGQCVQIMDHHCPWVNNCVGKYNRKYFLLFIFYTFLVCLHVLLTTVHRGYVCWSPHKRHRRRRWRGRHTTTTTTTTVFVEEVVPLIWDCAGIQQPIAVIFLIFQTVLSILFGLFTFVMAWEQCNSIMHDVTTIEDMQTHGRAKEENDGAYSNFKQVFGPYGISWLFPVPPRLQDDSTLVRRSLSTL